MTTEITKCDTITALRIFFQNMLIIGERAYNQNKDGWQKFIRFQLFEKECCLAFYSFGHIADGGFCRKYWPCLYVETQSILGRHDYEEWGYNKTDHYINGGVTFSNETLPTCGDTRWVGCDFNHGCNLHNTDDVLIERMIESIQGLIEIA